jgi:hypothetical protein
MSLVKRSETDYWTHTVLCERSQIHNYQLIYNLALGRKTLHVGCTDYPLEKPGTLHGILLNNGIDVDGYDIDEPGISKLRELYPGKKFFTSLDDARSEYDLVVIPEVIEHVTSHTDFFRSLNNVNFNKYFISVPNSLSRNLSFSFDEVSSKFTEHVHPDHKCWYSPYTIANLVESVAKWKIEQIYLLHNDSQIVLVGTKS